MKNNLKTKIKDLNLPEDLKSMSDDELNLVCSQIRSILVNVVSKNGGHLASNLGTVELTVAMHKVFDSPKDSIVWDVGHQAYTHKILTGRLDKFNTLRTKDGISGFVKPSESKHDAFISGHSSTSISAALGIATAKKLSKDNSHTIAVIGDGALTGGMAYEGLNNAGKSETNLIVVLNHNEMSISKNVGGIAKYLSTMRTTQSYHKTKSVVENVLDNTPLLGKPVKTIISSSKQLVKEMIVDSTMFEYFGFEYIGPVDGHNVHELQEAYENAKLMNRPVFIQVNTTKGKGYVPAEHNPGHFHGIGKFEIETGNSDVAAINSYSTVFGKELTSLAKKDHKICAVTAAMKYGTGLQYFKKAYTDRFFDVGISEQHAVTFCAGLAKSGMTPVFAVYSSFLQRAYDQILHDAAIDNLHIVLGIDRSGIVGKDGETHQGIFDVSFLSSIPNLKIYSPYGYDELKKVLKTAIYKDKGVVAIRYPKGSCENNENYCCNIDYEYQYEKNKILLITYGRIYEEVKKAQSKLIDEKNNFDILRLTKIYPYNNKIIDICKKYKRVIFIEESIKSGSISEKLAYDLQKLGLNIKYDSKTINGFVPQANVDESLIDVGLDSDSIVDFIRGESNND